MAQRVAIGRPSAATLATTILQIVPLNREQDGRGFPTKFVLLETAVVTYLVTSAESADGGALPTSGYVPFAATDRLVEYDISGATFLGLAATGAGVCRFELR